jgi:glycosyltransferase involved in cell wall biosynthesis
MDFGISGEAFICFAGEDWWYHHPHSKNHLLKRFAKDNKVLFVNSISMGLPSVSNPDFWLKVRRKIKSYLRWLRFVPEGLWVLTPIALPFFGSSAARTVNRILVSLQVRLAMKIAGMNSPIVWVAIPSAADMVKTLGAKAILYQVSDKYEANEDSALSRETIRGWHDRLTHMADLVMFSGKKLFEEAVTVPRRYFLEQAVDFEHFAKVCEAAPEMNAIPSPILFYMGAMDYVMDSDLVMEVAARRPAWQWVFVGLKSNLFDVSGPNIHFFGSRPYQDLPRFIQKAAVCVLPWRQNNAFTSYGSAIKVKEYLATGKPVVISPLYEYLKTPGIRIYRSADEFISMVEDALERDADRELRQLQVRDCTWDRRALQLGNEIANLLGRRAKASHS